VEPPEVLSTHHCTIAFGTLAQHHGQAICVENTAKRRHFREQNSSFAALMSYNNDTNPTMKL